MQKGQNNNVVQNFQYGDARGLQISTRPNNIFETVVIFLSYVFLILLFPLAIFFSLITIPEYERAVVFRLGRYRRTKGLIGPGVCFIVPCIDYPWRVDLRTISFDVPGQDILTKDSVTIKVDAIIYIRITDALKSVLKVVNAQAASEMLAQTTLRTVAGTKMLVELLTSRDQLSKEILHNMDEVTDAWGVKVERVEISDISLPLGLQRSMAAEQEATREAKAKIAAADGELKSSHLLKEASETMIQNPIALQLRYLQTLNTISSSKNHTIVMPLPLDLIRKLSGGGAGSSSGKRKDGGIEVSESTLQQHDVVLNMEEPEEPIPEDRRDASTQLKESDVDFASAESDIAITKGPEK